jgi:predicted MFS family arabinose efflux permease
VLRAEGSRVPAFLTALTFRSYRLLWVGAFLSSIGTWTQDVAVAWLIHTRTGDPFYLGLRAFVAEAPLIALMLVGGAVADRVDRRRIMLTSQVVQMGIAAALAVLYFTGHLGIGAILAAAFLTGLTQSQSAPAYQAVITSVVPPAHIANAVALNSLQFNLSRAVGPAVAGLLLARGGTGACFVVNVVSFMAVVAALLRLRLPPAPASTQSLGQSLAAGLRHVRASAPLSLFTTMGLCGSFLAFPLITYLPVVAGEVQGTGAAGYSALLSSFGAGAVGGAISTAHKGGGAGRGRRMVLAVAAYGACSTGAVFSSVQWVSMVLLVAAGWSLVSAFSTLISLVQENAPDELKGRIMSIYGVAFRGGMPLGSLAAGLLVRQLGAPPVIGGFSALLVLLCAAAWLRQPLLRAV